MANAISQSEGEDASTSRNGIRAVDSIAKWTRRRLSRRDFAKRVVAVSIAAIGARMFEVTHGLARLGCNHCVGPCETCYSQSPVCCSPNGSYCRNAVCNCPGCNCSTFYAKIDICDDGSYGYSCVYGC